MPDHINEIKKIITNENKLEVNSLKNIKNEH